MCNWHVSRTLVQPSIIFLITIYGHRPEKIVFEVCDQKRPNPVCPPTDTRYNIEMLYVESLVITLSSQRKQPRR